MRRADRLFEIIQILRAEAQPVTADHLATALEVSPRTIYRDIAVLQSMRTPIEGEAGIGYVMRAGYDLPPLNFDREEIEAIVVGLGLLARTGDIGLQKSARRAALKIDALQETSPALHVSDWGAPIPEIADPRRLREAIRETRKLTVRYRDQNGTETKRTICPIAMVYHVEATVLAAWCELRLDFRHFRVDRICEVIELEARFPDEAAALRVAWEVQRNAG